MAKYFAFILLQILASISLAQITNTQALLKIAKQIGHRPEDTFRAEDITYETSSCMLNSRLFRTNSVIRLEVSVSEFRLGDQVQRRSYFVISNSSFNVSATLNEAQLVGIASDILPYGDEFGRKPGTAVQYRLDLVGGPNAIRLVAVNAGGIKAKCSNLGWMERHQEK